MTTCASCRSRGANSGRLGWRQVRLIARRPLARQGPIPPARDSATFAQSQIPPKVNSVGLVTRSGRAAAPFPLCRLGRLAAATRQPRRPPLRSEKPRARPNATGTACAAEKAAHPTQLSLLALCYRLGALFSAGYSFLLSEIGGKIDDCLRSAISCKIKALSAMAIRSEGGAGW